MSPTSTRRRFLQQLSASALALAGGRVLAAGPADRKLGIALCGLGNYATNLLLPALQQSPAWRLAGVVTGDRSKGLAWARQHGFAVANVYGYESMGQMAANPEIDVVYVVTPNGLHARDTVAAARAGKHVICEKPMAVSVAECDAMIAACRSAGVRLMIGYRLHYEPHHVEFARLGKEEVFGPFRRMEGDNGYDVGATPDPTNWRLIPRLSGGGPLMDMGVYVIQAACMAKGEAPPRSITAHFGPRTRPQVFTAVEQSIRWTMTFADGAAAQCLATYDASPSHFRAEAARGWAELDYPAFLYADPKLTTSQGVPNLPAVNQQRAQLDAMAAEILGSQPSRAPGEMGRRDLAIVEAIYASARRGRPIEVRA